MKYKEFILNYVGNKYRESEKIKEINLKNVQYIVEPFGGAFGFSRYCFYNLGLKNKKYIIYDINDELIKFYKGIQKLVKNNKIKEFMIEYQKHYDYVYKNCHLKTNKKLLNRKELILYIKSKIKNKLLSYIFLESTKGSSFCTISKKINCDFEIFNNCEFKHKNFNDEDLNKFNSNYFFYLDPPYSISCNTFYGDIDNLDATYNTLYKIIITKQKKCLFIHSYNWFIDFVYQKKRIKVYDKLYQISKKKVKHICYGNCKFNNDINKK